MNPYFIQSIEALQTEDPIIADFQKRTSHIRIIQDVKTLSSDVKLRIDQCLEMRCKVDLPFYYQFNAYCYLSFGKFPEAERYGRMAIDNFRVCGMTWNEGISHWFLGLIYREIKRKDKYLANLNKALDIINPIYIEFLNQGNYPEAKMCETIKKQLEKEKTGEI